MALKNWQKEFESKKASKLIRWRNIKNSDNVEVHRTKFNETQGHGWFVDVITNKGTKSTQFNSKADALARANAYMRSH